MSSDTLAVVGIAAGWSIAVGLVGAALAWSLRRRSVRWSAAILGLVAVGGIVAGMVGTARAMFLSDHDFAVVITVCVVSGLVSVGFALWLGERVVGSARGLRDAATQFGEGGQFRAPVGGPREFAEISRELTRTSDRLRDSTERERLLEESRRELVAWVSHDLRTPLAGIRAMSEALEDGIAEDPARYRAQMRIEVDRMVRMVDDLFELSRIHAGTLQLSLETVQLGDLVSEAIAGVDPVARAKQVRVGGSVDAGVLVRADPNALARVVSNLVMNAIRHTPSDGTIEINAHAEASTIELSVTDGCGGIADGDLDRVFDVAWRGSHARTPGADIGAGLGLAIVKGIVEAHRGTVAVSNHAPGCRFVVRIPA
ncbi:sensor histidine kinase [Pengzhenrongella sicca]|uniref:Sensor-like histidine kinase SenX3 n=1 Tax=Pengzhenrongella sicca TaxID=2819238 RepID=A0A8A4ZKI5_9MICO|nr:HAMP domain-containing sensor histidine kinase [Pengzhenrongella sicca]QTE31016.1 HAMP domain-containing histidine kinase [Pengzhenrongella sicca]